MRYPFLRERMIHQSWYPAVVLFCGLIVCTIGLAGCKREKPIVSKELQWYSADDVRHYGTLYSPARSNDSGTPGFILLHSLNGARGDWLGLCNRLSEEGYLSLAYDMRGHGDSTAKTDWQAAIQDVATAKQALLDAGADPDNIFIIGSSLGANIGFKYAHGDSDIQGVILLSPGLEYKHIAIQDDMSDNRRLPVLLIASEGDSYSAGSIDKLKALSPAYAEARTYPGSAHGTELIMVNPQVNADILTWIRPIVK